MNSEKVQTIINKIISEYGYPIRKQYPVAKWQIETLTELGIIDLMPKEFGHGDARAVIEEAERGATAVMDASGEGSEISGSALYQALHEAAPETVVVTINEAGDGMPDNVDGIRFQFHDDGSATAYAWSAADFDDDLHAYCEDVEMQSGTEVLNVADVVAQHDDNDTADYQIEIDLSMLAEAQAVWKEMYCQTDEDSDDFEYA